LLKAGDPHFILKYAERVRQQIAEISPLAEFFSSADVLIPIPGSSPVVPGSVSVADHLARALLRNGIGQTIWPGICRKRGVRKSGTAPPGQRPTVGNHYDSFAIGVATELPEQILLIDDIVTKGRTLLAAAARLREVYPSAEIRAFALLRTKGFVAGVEQLLDPCVGEIRWRAGDAYRIP
jgi:hypothetical protein